MDEFSLSLFEPGYLSPQEFDSRKNGLNLTNRAGPNRREISLKGRKFIFSDVFTACGVVVVVREW